MQASATQAALGLCNTPCEYDYNSQIVAPASLFYPKGPSHCCKSFASSTQADKAGEQQAPAGAEEDSAPLSERGLFVAGLPFLHSDHEAVVGRLFGAFGGIHRVAVGPEQVCCLQEEFTPCPLIVLALCAVCTHRSSYVASSLVLLPTDAVLQQRNYYFRLTHFQQLYEADV